MRELLVEELDTISGGFAVPRAIVGAAATTAAYLAGQATSGNSPTLIGTAIAGVSRAFVGFFGGPVAIGAAVNC